jgi:hypothetical protein
VKALANRTVDTRLRRVFGGPVMIGLVSLSGLIAALLSADLGRYFAWIAVASPLLAVAWFWFQQFRSAK